MDIFWRETTGNAAPPIRLSDLPSAPPAVLLVYLDRYHLGDPLFLPGFARDVKAHEGPLVLVHGSGEAGERALEAEGLMPERRDGALVVSTPHTAALVERATRDLNRQIAHVLNEGGVPSVRMLGADRGLLRRGGDGQVEAGRAGWLAAVTRQGAVPVVATLVAGMDGVAVEVDGGAAVAALAGALTEDGAEPPAAVFFTTTRRPGLYEGGERVPSVAASALPTTGLAEPEAVRRAASAGVRTVVTTPGRLRGAGLPEGTRIVSG